MEAKVLALAGSPRLAPLARLAQPFIPGTGRWAKYKSALRVVADIRAARSYCTGFPVTVRLATASVCNYRCLFCEIHKDNVLYPDREHNLINLEQVRNYEGFLGTAGRICFYGGSAEPLLNKDFAAIAQFLKARYGNELMVNTNGSCLTEKLADALVECGFDYILLSYHAGQEETYRQLMTGDINRVDRQMTYLARRKAESGRRTPVVDLNFALHKLNAADGEAILDKARLFKAGAVHVNRYYGGRNKLQDRHVSFEFDVEAGNRTLDSLYSLAQTKGVTLQPPVPPYWEVKPAGVDWNPEDIHTTPCHAPWVSFQMDPVLDEGDCHYASVCNRITLFKIHYKEARLRTPDEFHTLWNHPVLRYLRETVNASTPNPICKYCRNRKRERLRNVDSDRYAAVRDQAVEAFFKECRQRGPYPDLPGVVVLDANPDSDARFKDKLAAAGLLDS